MTDTPGTLEERAKRIADAIVPQRKNDGHWWRTIPEANEHSIAQGAALAALTEAADEIASLRAERDRHQQFSERRFIELTEALEREASLRARVEAMRDLLQGVFDHYTDRDQRPGHAHTVPGIWDDDNPPELAGNPCEWCALWERARQALNDTPG